MFVIDLMSREPIYEQIFHQVADQILKGILQPGDKMPSVRSLSMELSSNPNTVQRAYTELDRRGLITSVPGRGSFISNDAVKIVSSHQTDKLDDLEHMLKDFKFAGIKKDTVMEVVDKVYEEGET